MSFFGFYKNRLKDNQVGQNSDTDLKRAVQGWCMYDWANSAFSTSISTAIMPVYFVVLFQNAFGNDVSFLNFEFTGSSTWSLAVAISTAIVAFSSPVLGTIADRTQIKKTLLFIYTLTGSLFTIMSFFSVFSGAEWAWILGCFMIANIGFAGGFVFYNSFLPYLGNDDELDRISSRGYAYGYVGGGLLLAIHLGAIQFFSDSNHLDLVTRICITSVGIWWFGWAIWTFKTVPEPQISNPVSGLTFSTSIKIAFNTLSKTFNELTKFKILLMYLVAYLLFNDGIQTVLTVAGAFGPDTLGISLISNMATILIVQFVAAIGAILFSKLASLIGAKQSLSITLLGWVIVIALAVGFAPLSPESHHDYDYQIEYSKTGQYEISTKPELPEDQHFSIKWKGSVGDLIDKDYLSRSQVLELLTAIREFEDSKFSISIIGGDLDETKAVGINHRSVLQGGPIDWWPRALRNYIWEPLKLAVDTQWLILGIMVGTVLGGSQALARSLFANMTPESRSAEFFSFFGFVGRASAVFGPMVYLIFTGIFDTRVAILIILCLIIAGYLLLRTIDVEQGRAVALEEDRLFKSS